MEYLLFVLVPSLLLSGMASLYVKSTFAKYKTVSSYSRITGAEAARRMLKAKGIYNVQVEETHGFLSDHYDPLAHVLRLSSDVFHGTSLSSIGVACHEAGHAYQHADQYVWLNLRSAAVPMAQFGNFLSYPLIFIGALMHFSGLIYFGVILFTCCVVFSLITLPVEWDASQRAKKEMINLGFLGYEEQQKSAEVLNAAFLTYVAAAVSQLLTLIYYLWQLGLIGGNRRD